MIIVNRGSLNEKNKEQLRQLKISVVIAPEDDYEAYEERIPANKALTCSNIAELGIDNLYIVKYYKPKSFKGWKWMVNHDFKK